MPKINVKTLNYGNHGEPVLIYHHIVLGYAAIKNCPLITETDYATSRNMTAKWFNSIVDWLCDNYPQEFKLRR